MELPANRRGYIREQLETSLSRAGVAPELRDDFIAACFSALKDMPDMPLTADMFDARKKIDGIAAACGISQDEARKHLVQNPTLFFNKNSAATAPADVEPHDKRIKRFPSDEEIAAAALRIKAKTGKQPNMRNKHDELPDGSCGWAHIIKILPERGLTIGSLVSSIYPPPLGLQKDDGPERSAP